jgi:ADP-ribosylglycohydrolase
MRCPGIFAAHLATDGQRLAADAALFAAATHNDFAAISSAVAFSIMLAELLVMRAPPHRIRREEFRIGPNKSRPQPVSPSWFGRCID